MAKQPPVLPIDLKYPMGMGKTMFSYLEKRKPHPMFLTKKEIEKVLKKK